MIKKMHFYSLMSLLSGILMLVCGCEIGSDCRYKAERTENLTAELAPASSVSAETHFGSINVEGQAANVEGQPANGFVLEAKITVQGHTQREADEILNQVKIELAQEGTQLTVGIKKPDLPKNCSVAASFNIKTPPQTNINARTSYGSIKIENITGTVKGHTSFASITCKDVQGPVAAKTSYGAINLKNVTGDIDAKTSFGSIKLESVTGAIDAETSYGSIRGENITPTRLDAETSFSSIDIECTPQTSPSLKAEIETSYGSIEFTPPAQFAGSLDMKTSYGSLKSDRPITVSGNLGDDHIQGQIGQGEGSLRLHTSFGSVKLK